MRRTIDIIHKRREKPTEDKDLLNGLFEINENKPERLNFTDIVTFMSINVKVILSV